MSRTVLRLLSNLACLCVACLIAVAAIGPLAGCETSAAPTTLTSNASSSQSSSTTQSLPPSPEPVMTTSPWAWSWPSPEASEAARSAISAWPSGIATLVLSTGYELYVVDHTGTRWTQEMQARPDTSVDPAIGSQEIVPFDGIVVSNNQEFIAYVDHAREIVVRSLRDGTEISRVPYQAEGETRLRCLSSDGNLAAIASTPPDLPKGTTGDRLPRRVTVLDMRSGETTIEQPLEDLGRERTADDPKTQFTLYSLDWLTEASLIVAYVGWSHETYVYDVHTDAMQLIPDVGMISAVSDSGAVYGWGLEPEGGRPKVWDGLTTQALELDPDSGYALEGAFNRAGDALALQVMSPRHAPRGWQLFRLSQGRWERSGPLAENSWMKAGPRALSDDGTLACTALEGGLQWANGQHAALLSYDFQAAAWQEWLGPENLLVDFGQFPFVAIIPER